MAGVCEGEESDDVTSEKDETENANYSQSSKILPVIVMSKCL